jgi:hypothetical protein
VYIAVFLLATGGNDYKLVVLPYSKDRQETPIELSRGDTTPTGLYVKTVEPGRYLTWDQKLGKVGPGNRRYPLRLKRHGIMLGMFESAASILYWDARSRAFKSICVSD